MDQIKIEQISDKDVWEKFVLNYPDSNFLQSWYWGEFHQSLGKRIYRIGFFKDKKLVGVMLGIIEKAKRATYLTVAGGPLIDWSEQGVVKIFKQSLEDIAKEENCSFVRVRPQILENPQNVKLFDSLGFQKAQMHLHAELTRQIDLTKPLDQLLSEMRKTTRYEVKKAQGLGIEIKTSQDPKDIDSFYDLQIETAKRQGFVAFSKDFLKKQFEIFAKEDMVILYTAFLGKQKLAQAFIIFYGSEAAYHYGASTDEGRKYPGAYLIQWKVMEESEKRGIKRYNLWGVAPEGQTDHRFHGVSVFKRGFGGADVEYLHARDFVTNRVGYTLNWGVETLRKWKRKV